MQDLSKISDHNARALARLAEQYKDKPNIAAILRVVCAQIQEVEDMLYGMLIALRLTDAVGVQLDLIGRKIGQPRESAGDPEYRLRLAARIKTNISTGAAEDLYSVFKILLPSPFVLAMTPAYPAGFFLDVYGAVDVNLVPMYSRFMTDAKAQGVAGQMILSIVAESDTFLLSADADPDSSHLGLGDDAGTSGGHLPDVV